MHLTAKFHHPMFSRSEVIVLTNKQTSLKTSTSLCYATPVGNYLIKTIIYIWNLAPTKSSGSSLRGCQIPEHVHCHWGVMSSVNTLWHVTLTSIVITCNVKPRSHDTTGRQTGLTTGFHEQWLFVQHGCQTGYNGTPALQHISCWCTVGLFDWCSCLEENGLAVNVLWHATGWHASDNLVLEKNPEIAGVVSK